MIFAHAKLKIKENREAVGEWNVITAIISLSQVEGAEIWLAGWLVCAILYFALLFLSKWNRSRTKNVLFWFLAAEALTDLGWALVYYDQTGYINYGIGAVYGLLLWPLALTAAGLIATMQNKKSGTP